MTKTIGIAGLGAIGSAVARALSKGITGYNWIASSNIDPHPNFDRPIVDFSTLAEQCDLIVEALPPGIVPELTHHVFEQNKDLILISASSLLIHKDILTQHKRSTSRIIVPSGALIGIDGVSALAQIGIKSAKIATTKKPTGYTGAPYIEENNIDLDAIKTKERIFQGNAYDAAKGFPANVNVAATLSLAGIGVENTQVEIWADPAATGNAHEIWVESEYSKINARVENMPDPANPKSSVLAAQSIISVLKGMTEPLVVL